jgi:outer membrane protein
MRWRACATAFVVLLMPAGRSLAQTTAGQSAPSPQTLTLDEALQYAVDHYPSVRAALEQTSASASGVAVARSAFLPRLDAVWQSNLATTNNVFGQLLPQSVIPAMSGPVLASASAQSVWSSATGALFSWEALDFGLRHASVAGAEATLTRARANEALTRLDVQNAVGTAFLSVLGAERAVVAAQADLDRREILGRSVQTLVDNQLRPGADASRADAERAAARTRLILLQENLTLAKTTLRRVLGVTAGEIAIGGDALIARMPAAEPAAAPAAGHPLAQVRQAAVDQARAFEEVLAHTDRPRVFVQSSGFARGSGADPSGVFDGGVGGLGLERANWAAGVQVVLPNLFDYASLRARRAEASASTRAETALHNEALLTISSQQQAATAMLQAARAVAANTPLQLAAAQQSERQARARYDAGLASVVEVADAQSLLAQAEVQDQLARVDVWRALLAGAVAQGDLAPFLSLVRQP